MKKVQKGFTLVELIVVITILAILGTIAFISLQGYSQDAKNSKVTSDLRTLTSAIETSMTDGTITSIDGAITATATNNLSAGTVADGRSLASADVSPTGTWVTAYTAGTVNFAALRQNDADFNYTVGSAKQDYLMGVVKVAAAAADLPKGAQMYQLAGVVNEAGTPTPIVKGNYVAYDAGDVAGLIADSESLGTPVQNTVTASMSGTTLY